MKRVLLLLLLAIPETPGASRYDRLPAQKKMDLIEQGRIPPGTRLAFSEGELNTFVGLKAKEVVPEGLRQPRIELRESRVIGHAFADFVKMRHAQGQDLNWLLSRLLEGERRIKVTGRVASGGGIARVDLEQVEVGGNSISGRALDLMIRIFVLPLYPQVKVGQEFELGYKVERVEIKPGTAFVVMASKKPPPSVASR
ncbi:MAG: hypothetical protein HY235_21680 [Acidobacteria bacterium]|nr:hypothetical protein [Acidobacteriota bacterium]